MKTIKKDLWQIGATGNLFLKGKGFFISYSNCTGAEISAFRGDTEDETAIVYKGKYYILNGDWREQYEKVYKKGIKACMQIFKKNIQHKSSWSN